MASCKMKYFKCDKIKSPEEDKLCTKIFKSEADMNQNLRHFCYGDLYILGRIYTESLKKVLTGSEMNLIPTVYAAKEDPTPKRPPKMKYTDLPIYEYQGHLHCDYKDWLEKSSKCPGSDTKILQEALLPSVSQIRKSTQDFISSWVNEIKLTYNEVSTDFGKLLCDVKAYCRCPEREMERQAVVAFGGLTGLFLARKRGIPTKILFSSLGLLATGALCFPKETDQYFRTCVYHVGKGVQCSFNCWCNANSRFRERVPCDDELPAEVKYPSDGNKCRLTD